jgi:hypothetical protein
MPIRDSLYQDHSHATPAGFRTSASNTLTSFDRYTQNSRLPERYSSSFVSPQVPEDSPPRHWTSALDSSPDMMPIDHLADDFPMLHNKVQTPFGFSPASFSGPRNEPPRDHYTVEPETWDHGLAPSRSRNNRDDFVASSNRTSPPRYHNTVEPETSNHGTSSSHSLNNRDDLVVGSNRMSWTPDIAGTSLLASLLRVC